MVHGQSECGRVGTDAQEFDASRGQGFYLNTQDPAQCTGTITQFQYCYYRSGSFAASYDFTFAVYRSMGSSYVPVSQAFTTGRTIANANLGFGDNFACTSYSVDEITVQAGDVIGVCIYDPPDNADPVDVLIGPDLTNRVQLDVVGGNAPSDRFLMSTGNTGCGDFSVPSSVSSLGTQTSRVLHIYADISKNISYLYTCYITIFYTAPLPTTESSTTLAPTMGTSPPMTTTNASSENTDGVPSTTTSTTESNLIPDDMTDLSTSFSTIDSDSTDATPSLVPVNSSSDTSGVVAAVVMILLLIIAMAVVAFIVVAILVRRRHSQKNLSLHNVGVNRGGIDDGIGEMVLFTLKR